MTKKQPLMKPQVVDIQAMEKRLPPKRKRSHHVVAAAENVSKSFAVGKRTIPVLKGNNLRLYAGEMVIVFGPSGSGKSTLLHTLIGLEPPTSGKVILRGQDLYAMNSEDRTNFRREKVGMVFQQSNWIKSLNVWENVAYPLYLAGYTPREAEEKAYKALSQVGLTDWARHKPMELSGGQQQRVSLARAIVTEPWMIVADEPTGNLDSAASELLMELLVKLNRVERRLVLMVTHDVSFLPLATRRVAMKDGVIVGEEKDEIKTE